MAKKKKSSRVKKDGGAFAPVVLGQRGLWSQGPGWAQFVQSKGATRVTK